MFLRQNHAHSRMIKNTVRIGPVDIQDSEDPTAIAGNGPSENNTLCATVDQLLVDPADYEKYALTFVCPEVLAGQYMLLQAENIDNENLEVEEVDVLIREDQTPGKREENFCLTFFS